MKRPAVVSLLLFLVALLVYLANGRTIGSGDTLPLRYLPYSLLRERNADLDEFPFLHDADALRSAPVLDGVPYFLHHRGGHYFSAYPPGPAILALPVYAGPVLAGASAASWAAGLEKLSAAAITALSVVCVFWALGGLVPRGWALGIAAIYAFGTSAWSVSSQALWQHGPSQLFLALLLVCLVRGRDDDRWWIGAGFAASAAAVMRSTDALVGIPVIAWLLWSRPSLTLRLVLAAVPPVAGLVLYNGYFFGSPLGPAGHTTAPIWAFFSLRPSVEGVTGVLLSPGRGLFVYSPILIFSVAGLLGVVRRGPTTYRPLVLGVALVTIVVGQWFRWWGGYCWGPRLLADITPVLCFFLYPLTAMLDRHRLAKAAFVSLAVVSVAVHGLGAFFYDSRWDAQVDVDRHPGSLWSWREGPLASYGHEAAAVARRVLLARETRRATSAESPALLAATSRIEPIASEAMVGETLAVSATATNTGAATWLAAAPGGTGTVRLGWRWSRDGVSVEEGRASLRADVLPGDTARFADRMAVPAVPGHYTLTIDLVSERVTWFARQDQRPFTATVVVRAVDLERLLSAPLDPGSQAPAATVSTDRASYALGDAIHLTVQLRNPRRPGQYDAYLIGRGPGGVVWFHDGQRPFRLAEGAWPVWCRRLPMPARVTGQFVLPSSALAPGDYRWHVVLTDSGTFHPLARGVTAFTLAP